MARSTRFPHIEEESGQHAETASPENSFQSPQDRHASSVHPGCLVHHSPSMEHSTRLATHGHPHSMSVRTEFGQGTTGRRTQVDTRCERNHKTRLTSSTSDKEADKHFFMRKQMLYFKMESSRLKSRVRVCLQCKEVFEKLLPVDKLNDTLKHLYKKEGSAGHRLQSWWSAAWGPNLAFGRFQGRKLWGHSQSTGLDTIHGCL